MKTFLRTLPALLIALGLAILAGCKEDEKPPHSTPPVVGQILISVGDDTLFAFADDTATTSVTIEVLDTNGAAIPGFTVALTVTATHSYFESVDTLNQAVTDDSGRVELLYHRTGIGFGLDTVTVSAGSLSSLAQILTCRYSLGVPSLILTLDHSAVALSPNDSVQATVHLRDVQFEPIAGATVELSAASGNSHPFPLTDSTGITVTYWFPTDTGHVWIEASNHNQMQVCSFFLLSDTAWVTVHP